MQLFAVATPAGSYTQLPSAGVNVIWVHYAWRMNLNVCSIHYLFLLLTQTIQAIQIWRHGAPLVAVKHDDSTPIQVGDSVGNSTTQNISWIVEKSESLNRLRRRFNHLNRDSQITIQQLQPSYFK